MTGGSFLIPPVFFWILCHADSHLKYINKVNSLHESKVAVIKKGKALLNRPASVAAVECCVKAVNWKLLFI